MSNLEKLIREFEKGSITSISENRRVVSPSLTLSNGSIVKKIVKAFELQTVKNAQQKQEKRRFSHGNTLGNREYNRRTFGGSTPAIYHKSNDSLQNRKDFRVSSISNIVTKDCDEINFVATNQYYSYGKEMKTLLGPKVLPNIKFVSENDMTTIRPSFFKKKIETKSLDQMFLKNEGGNQLITRKCRSSSPLENIKDNDKYYVLDDILTNSRISSNSSNSSYKNLQMKLYEFDDEWQHESSPVLQTSSSLHHDTTMSDDEISQVDLSLQSISKDITTSRNLSSDSQNVTRIARSSGLKLDQKPQILGAFLKVPVKISNTSITWIPTLNGKLPRKNSLKKMASIFTSRRRIIERKLKKKLKKQRHTYDLESSSSSSQYSWYSEPDTSINPIYQSSSPTFETFGRTSAYSSQVSRPNKSRLVLTELSREELATNLEPFKSIPADSASSSSQANRRNLDASKRATMESSPESKISYEHLSIPEHPHLFQKRVPKHPFVARTKIDKLHEKAKATKASVKRDGTKKELEASIVSLSTASSANISTSEISEWVTSSPNNMYDIPKHDDRFIKSMNALDEICSEVPPIDYIFRSKSEQFPPCYSPIKMRKKRPFTAFPTISLKSLKRLIHQEKLHMFGDSIDV